MLYNVTDNPKYKFTRETSKKQYFHDFLFVEEFRKTDILI